MIFNLILLVYLDVEDTHHRATLLDGGTVLNLPLFYLQGICVILYGFEYSGLGFRYLLNMFNEAHSIFFIFMSSLCLACKC